MKPLFLKHRARRQLGGLGTKQTQTQTVAKPEEQQQPEQQAPRDPKEDPDTLFSNSYARILEAISEGEIEGLCDRAGNVLHSTLTYGKAVFLDETALVDDSGKYALQGVKVGMNWGTADQDAITGFGRAAETITSGAALKFGQPVVISVTNPDADIVEVNVRFDAMLSQDTTTGDIHGSGVRYVIDCSLNGGAYVRLGNIVVVGKCRSPYLRTTSHKLPRSSTPEIDGWTLKISRVTKQPSTTKESNLSYVDFLTVYARNEFRYPYTAVVAGEISARGFAAIPARAYRIKGIRVWVPGNYFPETREYNRNYLTGEPVVDGAGLAVPQPFNGTLYRAWTNNPAWIIFDLLTNARYGLGRQMGVTVDRHFGNVDGWSLYPIAQYCDELVPDGFGGMEPRFTANVYIQAKEDAWKVVGDMASVFRGMPFWERGAVTFSQDRPKPVMKIFTNANVLDGVFTYSGSAKKARHTVAIVRYSDEDNFNRPAFEYVPDPEGVAKYGIRETQVAAFATTTRSQAHRVGTYILKSELTETELVTFSTGMEGAVLRPGMIFEVLDNDRAGAPQGGRVKAVSGDRKTLTLDRAVRVPAGAVHVKVGVPAAFLDAGSITSSDQVAGMQVPQLEDQVTTTAAIESTTTLAFAAAWGADVVPGAVWVMKTPVLTAQPFRLMSITEDNGTYQITGLQYNPAKFSDVDDTLVLDRPIYTQHPENPQDIPPPTNLVLRRLAVVAPEGVTLKIEASWQKSQFALTEFFLVEKRLGDGTVTDLPADADPDAPIDTSSANWEVVEQTRATISEFRYTTAGTYSVRVTAIATGGARSDSLVATIVIDNSNPIELYTITGLELKEQGNDTDFEGRDAIFEWRLNSPTSAQEIGTGTTDTGAQDPYFRDYVVSVWDVSGDVKVYEERVANPEFTFTFAKNAATVGGPRTQFRLEVRGSDRYGAVTAPARLVVQNPPPNAPTGLGVLSSWTLAKLDWINPFASDLVATQVLYGTSDDFGTATLLATVAAPGNSYNVTQLTAGQNYWFWVRAVDSFGSVSARHPTEGIGISTGTIPPSEIGEFSVGVTKIFSNTVALTSAIWKDNDPVAGAISWNSHTLVFQGSKYTIAAGNTGNTYVWWRGPLFAADGITITTPAETVYRTSLTHPKDDGSMLANDFIVATNTLGVVDLAWRAMANAVIGSAYIRDAAIKDAHVDSLSAQKLTAGTISGQVIQVGGVDGALQSTNYVPDVSGWRLGSDGTAELGTLAVRQNLALGSAFYNPAFGETRLFQARPDLTAPVVQMNHIWTATVITSLSPGTTVATGSGANRQTLVCRDGTTKWRYMLMFYSQLTTGGTAGGGTAAPLYSVDQSVPSPDTAPLFFGVNMVNYAFTDAAGAVNYIARARRLGFDGDNVFTIEVVCRGWDSLSVWYQIADAPVWFDATSGKRQSMGNRTGGKVPAAPTNLGAPWIFAAEQLDAAGVNAYGTLVLVKRVKINVPADKCILFGFAPVNGLGARVTTASSWLTYNGYFRVTAENVGNLLVTDDPGSSTIPEDV